MSLESELKKVNGYLYFNNNDNNNNENIEIFCLHLTGYLKTKKSIPICMFLLMTSAKYELQIYFTFLQEF